ncbi:MAG: RsmB/NOP family class I SAM-dependent RNA methyltransferase [Atopobiaceae bacterium]|jgi:16S rRNA (cytosine967-C5)-methyltransferase
MPQKKRGRLSAARAAALALTADVRRTNARVKDRARMAPYLQELSAQDKGFAMRLATGTLACKGVLDTAVSHHLTKGMHLEPQVHDALRLAAFELIYLSTPAAAAVNQGVEGVRRVAPRAAGMANAVLRRIAECERPERVQAQATICALAGNNLAQDLAPQDLGEKISLAAGLPCWLAAELISNLGVQGACRYASELLEPAPVYVFLPGFVTDADTTLEQLKESGCEPCAVLDGDTYLLKRPGALYSCGLVQQGLCVPADLAAQLVAYIAAADPDEHMLEIGQGRGTKSLLMEAIAERSGGRILVDGIDSEPFKVKVSHERMSVVGLSHEVTSRVLDARKLAGSTPCEGIEERYNKVFVDAPCSGTGTLRRHPEIAWSLQQEACTTPRGTLCQLQKEILAAAATRVEVGGELVYSTCSFLSQENEQQIEAFLATQMGAHFDRMAPSDAVALQHNVCETRAYISRHERDGYFLSTPGAYMSDIHFAARLVRVR